MPESDNHELAAPPPPNAEQLRAWYAGLIIGAVLLSALGWILARVVWLWFYFGLFFFLVAGLLVGAVAFRVARPSRPLTKRRILIGTLTISIIAWMVTVFWEYDHVARDIGDLPKFAKAHEAADEKARSATLVGETTVHDDVGSKARTAFIDSLRQDYWPGGTIGYIRWAVSSGEMTLTVDECVDEVSIDQRGWAWPIRSLIGIVLLAAGLWSNLESLRSAGPVSNFLVPGEEMPDDEQ